MVVEAKHRCFSIREIFADNGGMNDNQKWIVIKWKAYDILARFRDKSYGKVYISFHKHFFYIGRVTFKYFDLNKRIFVIKVFNDLWKLKLSSCKSASDSECTAFGSPQCEHIIFHSLLFF